MTPSAKMMMNDGPLECWARLTAFIVLGGAGEARLRVT